MTLAWILIAISLVALALSALLRLLPDNETEEAAAVELCTAEDFQHSWDKWSKVSPEQRTTLRGGYTRYLTIDSQYRQCKTCGLSERRDIKTAEKK